MRSIVNVKMREKLQRFFMGRYGGDKLNTAICVLSWISFLVGIIVIAAVKNTVGAIIGYTLYAVAIIAIGLCVFRMLSRNIPARRAEFEWYRQKALSPISRFRRIAKERKKQRATHRFFRCAKCRQAVRVPKGKGKIRITCPKCGYSFIKKT